MGSEEVSNVSIDEHQQAVFSESQVNEVVPTEKASSCNADQQSIAAPERKVATEDPTAIIESLRARLLSERSASKSAKQQAQQLARKVMELERCLVAEIQRRKRCEDIIEELIYTLNTAGIKWISKPEESHEEEEQKQALKPSKPSWISTSRRNSSDGSIEGDVLNSNEENLSPQSNSGSDSALVTRRIGRSCRTVRRKDTWEVGIDEHVKGTWSKVGTDIMEISKLRNTEGLKSESGWVNSVVSLFESNKQEDSSNGDHESDDAKPQPQSSEGSTNIAPDSSSSSQEPPSALNMAINNEVDQTSEESPKNNQLTISDNNSQASTSGTPKNEQNERDSVEDILRALRIAKEQLRTGFTNLNYGLEHNNYTVYRSNNNGFVTKPLAQFVPAESSSAFT